MRGKKNYKKRKISPDKKYNSILISEFINKVLKKGKKETASNIVYSAIENASKKLNIPPLELLETAIKNAAPLVEVRSKRIGGATYQVPMEVSEQRKIDLALRWVIGTSESKQGKNMDKFLADELLSMYKNEGAVIKKREDVHRMAEANKAFAHFARY